MIEVRGLTKKRKGLHLGELNFKLETGTMNLLVAKNSGGKSSLLKLLSGAISPDQGHILLHGMTVENYKHFESIGYVPSDMPLSESVSVSYISEMMQDMYLGWDAPRFNELLKVFKIDGDQRVDALSKGFQKMLMLAIAMAHRPAIYLLDEPTLGLDSYHKELLFKVLSDLIGHGTVTVVVASNAIEDFEELSDTIIYLEEGKQAYSGSGLDLVERYSVWKGLRSEAIDTNVYGQRYLGDRVELLVDPEFGEPASIREIVTLMGERL